jgi:cobalamin synthase
LRLYCLYDPVQPRVGLQLVVGLFILVGCLVVAGWSSRMTMALLAHRNHARTRYPAAGPGFGGKLRRLTYPQSWRDLLHVLVNFILSTITFSLALTWVFGGLGGVTYWFWRRWLPESSEGLPALLGYPGRLAELTFNSVLGALLLSRLLLCCVDSCDCTGLWRTHCWSTRHRLCVSRSAS